MIGSLRAAWNNVMKEAFWVITDAGNPQHVVDVEDVYYILFEFGVSVMGNEERKDLLQKYEAMPPSPTLRKVCEILRRYVDEKDS